MARLLPDVCRIQYGYPFDSARFTTSDGIPLIRIRDVVRGYSETYTTEECDEEYIVNDGDMLVGMDGEFNIARWKGGKAYLNQRVCRLIPNEEIHPDYLFHFMPSALKRIEDQTPFATVKHLSAKQLNAIAIHLPSMEQQKNIANQLETVDALISLRKQQITKLDELVKSRFVEMFGDPKDNPNGYAKRQLKETCMVITGNTPSRAVSEYYGEHIEWIKTDNIVSGLINPTPAVESLSEKGMAVSRTVEKNSILMACIAGSITSIGRVCVTDRKVAFNQQINAIVPDGYNVLFLYVLLQISKEYLVEEINMALKGILSKSKLEEKSFIVPPMELQEQFATFVKQTDKSKLTIQHSLAKLETLKKSLMQKYFG